MARIKRPDARAERRRAEQARRRSRLAVRCDGCGRVDPPERDVRIELAPGDLARVVGACKICGSETATYAEPLDG